MIFFQFIAVSHFQKTEQISYFGLLIVNSLQTHTFTYIHTEAQTASPYVDLWRNQNILVKGGGGECWQNYTVEIFR